MTFVEQNEREIEDLRYVRFYSCLILKDLLMDNPVEDVSEFYNIPIGLIQGFKVRCSVFAGVVVSMCKHLQWWNLYNILAQYMDRINFVV